MICECLTRPLLRVILLLILVGPGPTLASPGADDSTVEHSHPISSNICILDWGLPVCALYPGQCLQQHERVCFLPAEWAKLSTKFRSMKANLAGWPEHCGLLRNAERQLYDQLTEAADVECETRVQVVLDGAARAGRPALWAVVTGAGLAVVAAAGSIWCAVGDQPGDWPCWAAGASGLGSAGIMIFGW